MKSIVTRILLAALIVGAAAAVLTRTADAAHTVAEITALGQFEIGQPGQLQVALRSADDTLPVANAAVAVYTATSFGGVAGEVQLSAAVTDENGIAVLEFEPRSASDHEFRIEYLTPGATEPETVTTTISVVGTSQLHLSTSGIQVPGLNVWLIIAVVGGVWFLLFSVGWRVFAIAQAGTNGTPASPRGPLEA